MTDNSLPQTKAELIFQIDHEWSKLMDVVGQLSPEQMTTPDEGGWSPKDNLAHLTDWMTILLGYHLDRRPAHEVAGITLEEAAGWDFDVMNAIFFERHRHEPVEQVLDDLNQAYEQVRARLDSMSLEELMEPYRPDDPEKRPILNWVLGDTSEHFEEHRETIERTQLQDH